MGERFSPEVERSFVFFAEEANKTGLHPKDEDRFNEFIMASFAEGSRVSDPYLCERLRQVGFRADRAARLASYYDMGLRLLGRFVVSQVDKR